MSDGKKILPEHFDRMAAQAGSLHHLKICDIELGSVMRVETRDHWYEYMLIRPVRLQARVMSDDPDLPDGSECCIQGCHLGAFGGPVMVARVVVGKALAVSRLNEYGFPVELIMPPTERVFLDGDLVLSRAEPGS